jgi:hypothetical protein
MDLKVVAVDGFQQRPVDRKKDEVSYFSITCRHHWMSVALK